MTVFNLGPLVVKFFVIGFKTSSFEKKISVLKLQNIPFPVEQQCFALAANSQELNQCH